MTEEELQRNFTTLYEILKLIAAKLERIEEKLPPQPRRKKNK